MQQSQKSKNYSSINALVLHNDIDSRRHHYYKLLIQLATVTSNAMSKKMKA